MKRLITIIFVAIIALLPITQAFAVTYSIDQIEAYRHVVEPNDQLYMFKYTDSEVTDNLTFTLFVTSNNTILGTTSPYTYHTTGIAVIYFPAATAPTWNGAYSVNMTGSGSATSSTFSKWSTSTTIYDTSVELTVRILYLAQHDFTWATLTQTDNNGVTTLNAAGETYFVNTFPSLKSICPSLFSTMMGNAPVPQTRPKNTSAANTSDARLVGTPFDLTGIANFMGISREWATFGLWFIFWIIMDAMLVWKFKATRIALWIFGFAMIGGGITGFMGMLAGALSGIFGGLAIVYSFMWKQAP